MKVQQVVPTERELDLADLDAILESGDRALRPFDDAALAVCRDLSRALMNDPEASNHPDLQALAYWMRPSEIERLRERHSCRSEPGIRTMPRGLVFHLPPANVDTLFVYVWLLALLAGNRSVVRLSQRAQQQSMVICRLLNQVLKDQPDDRVADATVVLKYGHDEEITKRISLQTDVRVVWGGDESVCTIREIPLPPHALELTFPDRFSMAAFDARAVLALDDSERLYLADQFFNDAYGFDQMACGSPRLLVWCGPQAACAGAGRKWLAALLEVVTRREYRVDVGVALDKKAYLDRAVLDHPVSECFELANELAVIGLHEMSDVRGRFCGGGLFFQVYIERLGQIVPHIRRSDQTLTYFGFDRTELEGLVEDLSGRGVDRIVPIGRALSFGTYWDGFDLLASLSRYVVVE
ncbi:MAG: gamma-glutamyl phosphate reductase [bacterium]|nr:gamma-glutamyl phosphate reductase [bacterium]